MHGQLTIASQHVNKIPHDTPSVSEPRSRESEPRSRRFVPESAMQAIYSYLRSNCQIRTCGMGPTSLSLFFLSRPEHEQPAAGMKQRHSSVIPRLLGKIGRMFSALGPVRLLWIGAPD